MQKTKYKRQKIKLGFRLIWVASIGNAAFQTFPATCMGVYFNWYLIVCKFNHASAIDLSVCLLV